MEPAKRLNGNPKYNPQKHHRRSIRLKNYDYSQAGLYFITICCDDRKHRFGKIENHEMILNEYGTIAYDEWIKLQGRFSNFELDVFQIMPNHLHGIIKLIVRAGFTPAQFTPAQDTPAQDTSTEFIPTKIDGHSPLLPMQIPDDGNMATARVAPTVGDIVGAYKSLVANACLDIFKLQRSTCNAISTMGKLWQRNYYEHIIRDERSYQTISEYIVNNPAKWTEDKFYKQ